MFRTKAGLGWIVFSLALAAAIFVSSHAAEGPLTPLIPPTPADSGTCTAPPASPLPPATPQPFAAPGPFTAPPPPRAGASFPLIGEMAPAFRADTTDGPIAFPDDFKGKWVILFSHPGDFTPVCTTEFMTFATMAPEFESLNCKLLGLSIDSNTSHIAWLRTIQERARYRGMEKVEVTFPVIADTKMEVAKAYGMLQPSASDTKTVRAVFFIDPQAKVRAIIYYPLSNGRNFQEIKRLLIAMQTTDAHTCATPADWQPGDDVIVPAPSNCKNAQERVNNPPKDTTVCDWFLTFKKLPKDQLKLGK